MKVRYGTVRIGQVGFQPCMVESLGEVFSVRPMDLDPENVGTRKFGILVEGPDAKENVIDRADLMLVAGSTLANGTIEDFLVKKPVIFYGTTISGAAHLYEWERFCVCSHWKKRDAVQEATRTETSNKLLQRRLRREVRDMIRCFQFQLI